MRSNTFELDRWSRLDNEADAIREDVDAAFRGIDAALWEALKGTYAVADVLAAERDEVRLRRLIEGLERQNVARRAELRSTITEQFLKPLGWARSRRSSRGALFGCAEDYQCGAAWDHAEGFSLKGGRALKAVLVHNYWKYEPPLSGSLNGRPDEPVDWRYSREAARRAAEAVVMKLPESWYFPGHTSAWLVVRVD